MTIDLDSLMPPAGILPGTPEWRRWLAAQVGAIISRGRVTSVEWHQDVDPMRPLRKGIVLTVHLEEDPT